MTYTWTDIEQLVQDDPIVSAVLKQDYLPREQQLIDLVVHLSRARLALINAMIKMQTAQAPPPIVIKKDEP